MNLKEFKERIDFLYEVNKRDAENLQVVITTSDSSIGGRAYTHIKHIYRGIDWEHNQIRLDPEQQVVKRDK